MGLPMDLISLENITSDVFHGCFVVTCTLVAFIGLVWLREQILHAGGPDWLERENNVQLPPVDNPMMPADPPPQQIQQQNRQQADAQDNNNIPPFVNEPQPPWPDEQNLPAGKSSDRTFQRSGKSKEHGDTKISRRNPLYKVNVSMTGHLRILYQ